MNDTKCHKCGFIVDFKQPYTVIRGKLRSYVFCYACKPSEGKPLLIGELINKIKEEENAEILGKPRDN